MIERPQQPKRQLYPTIGDDLPDFRAMTMTAQAPEPSWCLSSSGQARELANFRAGALRVSSSVPGHKDHVLHSTNSIRKPDLWGDSGNDKLLDFGALMEGVYEGLPRQVASGWKQPRLTRLSMYHPLEACHVRFHKKQLDDVLNLLCQTFQSMSVQVAAYEESPIAASCWSLDQVEFRVSLWESRDDEQMAVLEVQRRSGDAYHFSCYARSIMALVVDGNSGTSRSTPQLPTFAIPRGACALSGTGMENMRLLRKAEQLVNHAFANGQSANNTLENKSPADEALEIANHLLCGCDRYDARQLGLESLCMLTDPNKAGLDVSAKVSEAILLGDRQSSPYRRMQAVLLPLAVTGSWPGEDSDDSMMIDFGYDDDDGDAVLDKGHPHAFLALQVLCQALQVLSRNVNTAAVRGSMPSFLAEARQLLSGKDLVQELLSMVNDAQAHPHGAFLALRCLTAVCRVLPDVRVAVAKEHETTVNKARQIGVMSHAALEKASQQLLEALYDL